MLSSDGDSLFETAILPAWCWAWVQADMGPILRQPMLISVCEGSQDASQPGWDESIESLFLPCCLPQNPIEPVLPANLLLADRSCVTVHLAQGRTLF